MEAEGTVSRQSPRMSIIDHTVLWGATLAIFATLAYGARSQLSLAAVVSVIYALPTWVALRNMRRSPLVRYPVGLLLVPGLIALLIGLFHLVTRFAGTDPMSTTHRLVIIYLVAAPLLVCPLLYVRKEVWRSKWPFVVVTACVPLLLWLSTYGSVQLREQALLTDRLPKVLTSPAALTLLEPVSKSP